MGCSRCGSGNSSRAVPPPSIVSRPGSQVPRPPQTNPPAKSTGNPIRDAINNMRLPYVPR